MLRRTKEKEESRHITDELSEGVNHLRSAAALAAEQAAERLAPAVENARTRAQTTIGPRVERAMDAAAERAESARKMSRKARKQAKAAAKDGRRWADKASDKALRRAEKATAKAEGELSKRHWGRWMLGALGVGAAIGTVGALIRRRRAAEWEEEQEFGYGDDSASVTPMPTPSATGPSGPKSAETPGAQPAEGSFGSGAGDATPSGPDDTSAAHVAGRGQQPEG
ncbi:MAG: hypothetical protein GEU94_17010 [Micromonosporaceae bacterium]|nr:hypothetical protein [Micromonosporaceae bacterium]